MSQGSAPTISVIIPTLSRPRQLTRCLDALARQIYPRELFEVIVADDGSPVSAASVVDTFRDRLDVTFLALGHAGPGAARNAGASRARGDVLAFTDDDCEPEPNWLVALANQFANDSRAGAGGRVVNALHANIYSEASQLLISYLYEYGLGAVHPDQREQRFFCTSNLALPASAFRELGGFDEKEIGVTGEDRELCERWLHSGHELVYVGEAVVRHSHELGAIDFLRQHWRYGQDGLSVHRARVRRTGRGPRVYPSFYAGMLLYPFRAHAGGRAPLLAVLLASTQATYAAALLWRFLVETVLSRRRHSRRDGRPVPADD
ncbi:MAG: glycosyltransferase [Gemmatimonadota bacterium]|nr:glycosyltransferase [Gemmatimonadota bacterium]